MIVLEKSKPIKTKRVFTTRGKKPDFPIIQNTKNLVRDFSKMQNKMDFWDQLNTEMIFDKNEAERKIHLVTNYLFLRFLKAGAEVNKSLEIIQKQSTLKFKTLIETLVEKINLDIEDFKRLIFNWSNGKYLLNIEKRISIITPEKNILTLDKANIKKRESQLDYEIAFFFRRNLFSLLDKTIKLITTDYSHLYSL